MTDEVDQLADIVAELTKKEAELYEIVRPAREVDSRGLQVSAAAISLLVLSMATQKPDQVSTGLTSVGLDNWLLLAIPLALLQGYWMWDLRAVWKLTEDRVSHTLREHQLKVRVLGDFYARKMAAFLEDSDTARSSRDQLWQWYEAQLAQLNARREQLPEEEYFGSDKSQALDEAEAALEVEFKRLQQTSRLDEHEKQVDEILDRLASGQPDPIEARIKRSIDHLEIVTRAQKQRRLMGLRVPMALAILALAIFLIEVLTPLILSAWPT